MWIWMLATSCMYSKTLSSNREECPAESNTTGYLIISLLASSRKLDSSLKINKHGQVFIIKLKAKILLHPNYNVSNFVLTYFWKRLFACKKIYFHFIWSAFCSPSHLHFVVISELRLYSRKLIPTIIRGCLTLQFSIYTFSLFSQVFDLFWFFSPAFCSPHGKYIPFSN